MDAPATPAAAPGPADGPESALPSVEARVAAFVAILVGGGLGGLIGHSFIDLQCEGACTVPTGLGMLVGTLVGSVGVAVVAVLTLRAFGEWRTIRARQDGPGAPG